MASATIDYDKLAQQHGGSASSVDYDALATQHGGTAANSAPATSPQAPQDGFFHSLGSSLGITPEAAQDRKDHPIKAALLDAVVGPAGDVAKSLYQQGKQSFNALRQAAADYKGGNTPQAAVDAVQAVPIVGPAMVKATDQYAAGNKAGAAGTLLGAAAQTAPMVLGAADAAGIPRPNSSLANVTLPLRPAAMKEAAGGLFQSVAKDANSVPVALDNTQTSALRLMDWQGKTQLGPTINKFLNRITKPNAPALTYGEARDFYQVLGRLSADETTKLPPAVQGDLAKMVNGFKQDIGNSADQVGRAADYYQAMGDYATASRLQGWYDFAKKTAIKGAIGGGIGYEAYKQYQK